MGVDRAALVSPKSILRFIELIFSIITFSVIAQYTNDFWGDWNSKIGFTLFVGITTMLLCMLFIPMYALGLGEKPTVALIELIINVVWWVFWLSAAACISDLVRVGNNYGWGSGDVGDRFRTSCAFAWLTFFLWTVSTALTVMTLLEGRRGPAPPTGAATTEMPPPPPTGNVGMV